jgi:hypothetical protein
VNTLAVLAKTIMQSLYLALVICKYEDLKKVIFEPKGHIKYKIFLFGTGSDPD